MMMQCNAKIKKKCWWVFTSSVASLWLLSPFSCTFIQLSGNNKRRWSLTTSWPPFPLLYFGNVRQPDRTASPTLTFLRVLLLTGADDRLVPPHLLFSRSSLTCFVIKINPWSSEAETGRAKPYMASRVEGGFLYRMVCVGMTFHAIFTGEFQRAARAAHAKATRPRGCRIVFRGSSSALWPPRPSDRALHLNLDLRFDVSHGQSILT